MISEFPAIHFGTLMNLIVAGLIFGLVARFFIAAIHFASDVFYKYVRYLPLRTMAGGIVIMLLTLFTAHQQYNGLGTDKIISSFYVPIEFYDFLTRLFYSHHFRIRL